MKRKHVFRPGLFPAAAALGVNYSHLRRVVIGERVSARLMKRYHALKAQVSTPLRSGGSETAHRERQTGATRQKTP